LLEEIAAIDGDVDPLAFDDDDEEEEEDEELCCCRILDIDIVDDAALVVVALELLDGNVAGEEALLFEVETEEEEEEEEAVASAASAFCALRRPSLSLRIFFPSLYDDDD
jgi:hypothetical protein